jgi:hypothetical protein
VADASPADAVVAALLRSNDPSIRHLTLTSVLGLGRSSSRVRQAQAEVLEGARVRALLAGQQPDGGFGVNPYQKWTGAFWRLLSLVDLGVPTGEPRAIAAAETVLDWLAGPSHLRGVKVVAGRARRCASQEGFALRVCSRLGMAETDPRVKGLARSLVRWQWPDGGWNCDKNPAATHSSFHETWGAAWGLAESYRVTGDKDAIEAARRAGEFILRHHVFRSERTGDVIHPNLLKLRYPPYWYYGLLPALRVLAALACLGDPRAEEALDVLEGKRGKDGLWKVDGAYWRRVGGTGPYPEVVDWGRSGRHEMVSVLALGVLAAAGRIDATPSQRPGWTTSSNGRRSGRSIGRSGRSAG